VSWRGFGKRIGQAILDRQSQIGHRLTLGEIGVAVAKREKRSKPYGVSTVAAWIEERNEPTLAAFAALAAELGTTPGWLAFSEKPDVRVYVKQSEEAEPVLVEEPQRGPMVAGAKQRGGRA